MHKGFGCTKIEALVKLAGHNFSRPGELMWLDLSAAYAMFPSLACQLSICAGWPPLIMKKSQLASSS